MKDLRLRFAKAKNREWSVKPGKYTVEDVALKVRRFMFDEMYVPAFSSWEEQDKPFLGIIVAGYSPEMTMAEEYSISMRGDKCEGPNLLRDIDEVGVTWNGEPEAVSRLILGYGTALPIVLRDKLGVPEEQVGPAVEILKQNLVRQLVQPAMPFQDAIDLAEFLVDTTVKYSRFAPGAPTVGGPIEVAGISKHEGFKWIRRKHYYSREFNPTEDK